MKKEKVSFNILIIINVTNLIQIAFCFRKTMTMKEKSFFNLIIKTLIKS